MYVLKIVSLRCLHNFVAEDHFEVVFKHVTFIHKSPPGLYYDFSSPLDFSEHTFGFFEGLISTPAKL